MNIGIIGSGNMGSSLGKIWAERGHQVMFSYSRNSSRLHEVAQAIGENARVGTPVEAVQFGEIVLMAAPWTKVPDALTAAGASRGAFDGKIVVDCTNPIEPGRDGLAIDGSTSGAEEIAKLIPGARVVKAFNTVIAQVLRSASKSLGSRMVTIFYCGDDESAKMVVAELITDSGFEAVDAGGLHNARYVELDCTLSAWSDQLRMAGYSL